MGKEREIMDKKRKKMTKQELEEALQDMGIKVCPNTLWNVLNGSVGGYFNFMGKLREFRIDVKNGITKYQEVDVRFDLDELIPKPENVCTWTYDADLDCYNTSCGNSWRLNDGTPAENRMTFCLYCGDKLEEEEEVQE